jgi:hypothetical protein
MISNKDLAIFTALLEGGAKGLEKTFQSELDDFGQRVYVTSQKYVPVKTGTLKASGRVVRETVGKKEPRLKRVLVDYGPARDKLGRDYSKIAHWGVFPTAKRPGGAEGFKSLFLSRAVTEEAPGFQVRMKSKLKQANG